MYPRRDGLRVRDRLELVRLDGVVSFGIENRDLGVAVGITDLQAQQEAVELRLGQRVRAFELDGVLRRDHHERARQLVRLRVDGDLTLFHRLEESRLRLR